MVSILFSNLDPINRGAQFMPDNVIALFEFDIGTEGLGISAEKHYKLVSPEDVTAKDLKSYMTKTSD